MQFKYAIVLLFFFPFLGAALLFSQQKSDCRLKLEELKPLIERFNPFFANHNWDPNLRMEMARIGQNRFLIITQEGCKRHHTTFTLVLEPEVSRQPYAFWIDELKSMMYKVYFQKEESYREYQAQFEELFEEKFIRYGFNNAFNFPIGTRNFICNVNYHPTRGGRIYLEIVEYIFSQKVSKLKPKGIPQEKDDGWKKGG